MTQSSTGDVYRQRRAHWQQQADHWAQRERWTSWSRLAAMALTLIALWFAVQSRTVPLALPLAGGLAFLSLVSLHDRLLRRQQHARRVVDFYAAGIRRLEDRWQEDGVDGNRLPEDVGPGADHPYAADLDLFGRGSLFQLLCRARTGHGQATLARWLLGAAARSEVEARQAATAELRDQLDLRERLATIGDEVADATRLAALARWAHTNVSWPPAGGTMVGLRILFGLLGLANVAAALAWWPGGQGPAWLLILLVVETLGFLFLRGRLGALVDGVEQSSRSLTLLRELLGELERNEFTSPWLQSRRAQIVGDDGRHASASHQIERLRRLVDLLDAQRNPMFVPFALLLLWGPQVTLALHGWRRDNGSRVARWLESLGEVEALASLAGFAAEHSDAVFPDLLPEDAGPRFVGRGVGHPLLPRATCITNDLELDASTDTRSDRGAPGAPPGYVISGSNMSGKSTFLRACGLNAVLAQAGGVVRAEALELSPLQLATSIRIQDSLQQGHSKFYAEIRRLRLVLDLATAPTDSTNESATRPVFFLLDEILHGTNSHDRRIGAQGVIEALLDRGAIGLVTTHDLALARLATEGDGEGAGHESRLINKHFVDTIEDGRIVFDYRLREGVVTRSNALALMREVGLDV